MVPLLPTIEGHSFSHGCFPLFQISCLMPFWINEPVNFPAFSQAGPTWCGFTGRVETKWIVFSSHVKILNGGKLRSTDDAVARCSLYQKFARLIIVVLTFCWTFNSNHLRAYQLNLNIYFTWIIGNFFCQHFFCHHCAIKFLWISFSGAQ